MKDIFVLDACALVALLKNEKGSDIVADIYKKASSGGAQLYMNRILLKGSLLTSDHHEFDGIEGRENIHFAWIR